jgi:hypothetical protein
VPAPRRRGFVPILGFLVLTAAYLLSSGAAMRLEFEAPSTRPLLALYAPVFWTANQSKPVFQALQWYYVEVWRVPEPVAVNRIHG